MSILPQRRVRTLSLAARDRSLVRRGVTLLEDALRTMSPPSVAGGGILLVRSLQLGAIRSGQSPSSIAADMERRLRDAGVSIAHGDSPAAATRPAVYFSDEAEPYLCLARRLAARQPVNAWFWPLAAPPWRPAMPLDDALRSLVHGVAQTRAGAVAVAKLAQELHQHGKLPALLSALRREDGPALLRSGGWSWPAPPLPWAEAEVAPIWLPPLAGAWRPVVQTWASRWGADDARTLWLSLMALVAERPVRLLQPGLDTAARQAIRQALAPATSSLPAGETVETPQPSPPGDERNNWLPSPTAGPPSMGERPAPEAGSPAHDQPVPADREGPPPGSPPGTRPPSRIRVTPPEQPDSGPEAGAEPAPVPLPESQPWRGLPSDSDYAGLLFLIPVMARLGIREQLQNDSILLEMDFPARLLLYAADRLGAPAGDPVRLAASVDSEAATGGLAGFLTPAVWQSGLAAPPPGSIRRLAHAPRGRAAYDGSGRLCLAAWSGGIPGPIRVRLTEYRVRKGRTVEVGDPLALLLDAWLVALRRWCRRYASLGLRDIICRPGRIAVTRTHVYVLFDLAQVDLRIRQAGLDINPGWVPWLGKVVQHHYVDGGGAYAIQ